MRLLDSMGPNPRMVRMFMIEKGIELELVEHDILGAENRKTPYTDKNPGGQMPALELDDGSVLAETVVICEYLEEIYPSPALIGSTVKERAEARMWTRRVEQKITENMYNGYRFSEGLERFKDRLRCLPEAADGLKAVAKDGLAWLDILMEYREYVCGDRLTISDLVLYCCTDFAAGVGQKLEPGLGNIKAWFTRLDARPSATASLHPVAVKAGRRG